MKFFLSFLQSDKNYPIPAYNFWQHYIKNGVEEAGHEWQECPGADWALGLVPQRKNDFAKWKQDTWEKTVEWLKKHPADIFLSYLYPEQIDTSAIREIQKAGIPCVNFFCDHVRLFKEVPPEFKVFDLNWVPEFKATEWYAKAGYPYINLPMPVWVEPKCRVLREEKNQQITFIGSCDIQRKLLFEKLIALQPELPLAIYGNGWGPDNISQPRLPEEYTFGKKLRYNLSFLEREGIVPFWRKIKYRDMDTGISALLKAKTHASPLQDEYKALTAESMVTLGVNRFPSFRFPANKPGSYSRLRDIEAPMLGACYLTEYTDGIDELYDTENEIAVYKNMDELSDQIKILRANPDLREKLRINGQKRALNEHAIPNSLHKILIRVT